MPILDPSLQCFLVKSIKENEGKDGYSFLLKYLQIASRNLHNNSKTVESSIQFKRDFEGSLTSINEEYGCTFTKSKLFCSSFQRNCYKYFYKHLKVNNKEEESRKFQGRYIICNDRFNVRFFRPYIFHSKYHSWFLSDTPIAILSINSKLFSTFQKKEENQRKILQLIKLEIDLISASGLLLILCFNYTTKLKNFFNQLIKDDQFAEIHCNIFDDNDIKPFLTENEIKSNLKKGYFYLYCHYLEKNTEEQLLMKKLKRNAHVTVVSFSKSPSESLKKYKFYPTQPFFHVKSVSQTNYLRVFLTYVPLFDTETDSDSFIPSDVSNLCLCYININDFLIRKQTRVQILFDDEIDRHHHKIKYVNYEDLHKIRTEFFVEDPLSLTRIKDTEIQRINRIRTNVIKKIDSEKNFRINILRNYLKIGNYEEFLKYVTYAYSHFIRSSISEFAIHRAQIFAALEACETCFSVKKDPNQSNSKGVIYQVDTGEGKSCIICLIAAILALKNYTVHIASSNIKLSNRDYFNSFEFFQLLGIQTAVLLHKNELPYHEFKGSNQDEREEDEENQQKQLPLKELYRYENDNFFKSNADYYFEVNSQKNEEMYRKNYPDKFFGPELFKNSSRMNFSVCGLDNDNNANEKLKANVIFSTFVNFECFYLHLIEMCPGYIKPYFSKCGLLIDEADSFLIDEITNGTIISREIRSNAQEILTYVYEQKEEGKTAQQIFEELKKQPMCSDLEIKDVEEMFKEIELVNSTKYSKGAKYSVEEFEVRNNHRIRNLIRKTIKATINYSDTISNFLDEKLFNKNDDEDENEEDEDEEFDTRAVKKFKKIVPFDFDHKGILEPNKEFSGFVQQFISIKESKEKDNENLIFKDISMSYLYISHPVFANLYTKICGFTGTIGDSEDKKIYKDYYQLDTKKVPRNKINLRINLPSILCRSIPERNEKILQEVIAFHIREIPVLVIFQELTEIEEFQTLLFEHGIQYFNIFNGKEEYVSPDKIAGIKGSISLGTNFCGRGTDILYRGKPLHVIVSFYSTNVRVMNQAFGRTARQGQAGTCRCICLISQCFKKQSNSRLNRVKKSIETFEYKIEAQKKFIEHYKKIYPWMFNFDINKPTIPNKYIIKMRKTRINVNRIIAYKYKYPICMSVKTFLKIQSQKIFSLFNCPNSKYTWLLFQRYIREMILESWSLMIQKFEQKMNPQQEIEMNSDKYNIFLDEEIKNLHKQLSKYLPKKKFNIFSTFMCIYKKVIHHYEKNILKSFQKLSKAYIPFAETHNTIFQLGFKPYSLLNRSGARINYNNNSGTNYIIDPELKYQRKMPDNKFSFISITERIDMIYNAIFQKISSTLGEKVFLKFFLRRTLAGCEFGLCYDINLINSDENLLKDPYCLIDKDPLLVFTIFLWSTKPIMAGVLIFVLVYVIGLCKKITTWIETFPEQIPKEVIKQGAISMIKLIVPEVSNYFLEKIVNYLEEILEKQIDKLSEEDKFIIGELRKIFVGHEFEKIGDTISEKISTILGGIIKIPKKFGEIINESMQMTLLMKIGFILLLLLGTYIRYFMNRKDAIEHAESNANMYDSTFDNEKSTENTDIEIKCNKSKLDSSEQKLDEIIQSEKTDIELTEIPLIEKKDEETIVKSFEEVSKTFNYKFKTLNLSKYELKSTDFELLKYRNNACLYQLRRTIYKPANKICLRLDYKHEYTDMINLVRIHATNVHPTISFFIGYNAINDKKFSIFVEDKEKGFLSEYVKTSDKIPFLNSTEKLIIAYGLASVLEFFHSHNIIIHDFKPDNILLDSQFYPYLFDFCSAKNIDDFDSSRLEGVPILMAPEMNLDDNINPFPLDVYAYGINLYMIITQKKPYPSQKSLFQIFKAAVKGERPQIPDSTPLTWKNLIERCWNQDPNQRPTFTEICDILESSTFVNPSINIVAFNDYKKIIKPYRPSRNDQS